MIGQIREVTLASTRVGAWSAPGECAASFASMAALQPLWGLREMSGARVYIRRRSAAHQYMMLRSVKHRAYFHSSIFGSPRTRRAVVSAISGSLPPGLTGHLCAAIMRMGKPPKITNHTGQGMGNSAGPMPGVSYLGSTVPYVVGSKAILRLW